MPPDTREFNLCTAPDCAETEYENATGLGFIFQYLYQLIMILARSSGEIHVDL